jgi:hypothetical protein
MSIQRTDASLHWSYFLALEEDLERLSRYVDFSGNDQTYSLEIARLLLSSSSEVDVVLRQLSKIYFDGSNASSINAYFPIINEHTEDFINFEVTLPRYGLTLKPWTNWGENEPPLWWQAHNKVKHHRHQHFTKASLKNCLNAVAALYIAVLYLLKAQGVDEEVLQIPKILNVANHHKHSAYMGHYGQFVAYNFN